jgi:3-hydroxy-9,10-secoandrosta-1,3,5(10)-triene-9,17-dione monooxygenase reductase component
MFAGCCVRFQCTTHFICDGGDHIILIGRVLEFDQFERTPLVFHSGKYCHRTAEAVAATHRT